MTTDDIKNRFVSEIKLRGYDDKYIDRNEEREILQIAIQLGVSIENALTSLQQVCEEAGYIQETQILQQIKTRLESAAGADGRVDEREFELVFHDVRKTIQGKKNDRELKKLIVQVMEDTGNYRVKTGWFRDWYSTLKKELGI
jgi:hypothetical protein